ncbi:hypothetical protein E8E12_008479 [Didymella heteroderae]|uniref:DNA recombination and repair protein Rad51-like C-terminal domain-containing protein n=1 Tax=Didymella heteroderae TaxID=1769908 RepID=A0A9P4WQE9_9PLEO|nr:hypothetical protein E8E12_008479 [Didymella heteroderae]
MNERIASSVYLNTTPYIPHALAFNIRSLDAALGAAFQPASLVTLSAETSKSLTPIAQALLVDALLRYPEQSVAVVDATGNFDVVALYKLVLARLERESGKAGLEMEGSGGGGVQEMAARTLDRVRILRVFDFVGMKEAVGELRDGLEGKERGNDVVQEEMESVSQGIAAGEANTANNTEEGSPLQVKRTEVADSEDEEEDLEDLNDEMLFDTTAPAPDPVKTTPSNPIADASSQSTGPNEQTTTELAPQPPLKTILIDNLAQVLAPLLKQDTVSANKLATTFLTTLSNLTRDHTLHTILLNPCTTPRAPPPSRRPADNAPPGPQQGYTPQPPPPPSIFSSNLAVPALLGLMSRYVDTQVLVSMLPRRKLDARAYYADSGSRDRGKRRGVEMVSVVEVVADRWGGKVGAWGAFKEGKDGGIAGL